MKGFLEGLLVGLIAAVMAVSAMGQPPVRLVSQEKEATYRSAFPAVDDIDIQNLLESKDLIFYTEREIPRVYQHSNTFHSPSYNISAEFDPLGFGNGNREFPWMKAGGTHNVRNLEVFRFMQLPKDKNGRVYPVVYWNERLPGGGGRDGSGSSWRWMYPVGTTFGELLGMNHNGATYPFELRFRFREGDEWAVEAFRPFPTSDELSSRIKKLRPEWQQDAKLSALVTQLDGSLRFATASMRDHSGRGFNRKVKVHPLPPIGDDDLVARLLIETRWRSALGEDWKADAEKGYVSAPTVNRGTGLHIVPEGYRAHGFGVDRYACISCHEHTNKAVNSFQSNRGWYGRIRGSDGIFSFHPISRSSISGNGARVQVRMHSAMVQAGVVERYSPSKHPKSKYRKLESSFYTEGK